MIQSGRSRYRKLSVASYLVIGGAITLTGCFAIAFLGDCALAQIIPDTTLGNENSTVTSTGAVDQIDGGATRGANLFHSFQEFNIGNGRSALFSNPPGIENILSRVTGANPSFILGTLGVSFGNANLFLINPNGIIFGQNASLNVGGSFVASTANAVQFGNIGFFSATDKNIPSPLLTINPSALLFNQINQNAAIQNNSVAPAGTDPAGFNADGLRVPDGKSLLLVGGNVSMDGGELNANGGRVELGGLAEPGTVALRVDGDNLSLIFPENVARTEVSLTNQAGVFVTGAGGGNIAVNARNLEILGGSILSAGIGQGLGTPETIAGDITLNATGEIKVASGSRVRNLVRLGSQGNAGNITIDAGSLSLRDGAQLEADTNGQGNAGNVTVRVKDAVSLAGGQTNISSTVDAGGVGKGGNIDINAATLSLTDGAKLQTATARASNTQPAGRGDAGNINLNVTGAIDIAGKTGTSPSGIFSRVETGTEGNAGNITIDAGSFSLRDGAQLAADTNGQGNAGNVTVQVKDAVHLANSRILSSVDAGGVGNGGNITINAGSFSLRDRAQLTTSTRGQGNAGNVTVQAKDAVDLANSRILSTVSAGGVGKGGNININAATLSLTDGAQLLTLTARASNTQPAGQGDAGNININVAGAVDIAGKTGTTRSGIFSYLGTGAVGNGGNITIDAASLSLRDGAQLAADTNGQGNAGNVTVRVRDSVSLVNGRISSRVQPSAVGKGGNIDIHAATLSLTDGAQLLTRTARASNTQPAGQGDAGNININVAGAVDIAGKRGTGIFSYLGTGAVGNGGNITIDAASLSLRDGAQLEADTLGQGNAGNVTVRVRDSVSVANGGGISSRVQAAAVGKGGNIDIHAATLSLTDGAQLVTRTGIASDTQPAGQGDAGNININVTGAIDIAGQRGTGIFSYLGTGAVGNAGNITIDAGSLSLRDRARLSAETYGQGNAGTIKVNAADFVIISGKSSNLNSALFVFSASPTGTAGDIIITSPRVTLDNGGRLNAQSASGNGGNINVQTDLLLLRRGAQISTTAGTAQAGGNGGNITINAPSGFIVAVPRENSDITANAFSGSGGRVTINATGIYGMTVRSREDLVRLLGTNLDPQRLPTSDITAISQTSPTLSGQVIINTPDVDPSRGLINLPAVPVDTSVAQTCTAASTQAQSSFIITGRGGLPPNPKEALSSDDVQVNWVPLNPGGENPSNPVVSTNPTNATPAPLVEAQGWVTNDLGQVVLTASAPTVTPHSSWLPPNSCGAPQSEARSGV